VQVNLSGGPERDDYGLPPVEVEIPDDARELDRDVQAYHRELRAQRRRRLLRRLAGPWARDGLVLPLLAACLVLALIAGTLLNLFSADQAGIRPSGQFAVQAGHGGSRAPVPGSAASPARSPGQPGGPLPAAVISVAGRPVALQTVASAVLMLVPASCRGVRGAPARPCATALRALARQVQTIGVMLYLVGRDGALPVLHRLARRAGNHTAVADDATGILARTYQHAGLTAILVRADGSVVAVDQRLKPGARLTAQLRQLR
jgi:hypothetical protein